MSNKTTAIRLPKNAFFLVVSAVFLAISLPATAQQPKKIPRIGILSLGSGNPTIDAFRQGLHELGWVDGKNIALEYRSAEGNQDRSEALVLRINVDIILVTTPQAADAARKLTKTIPIVVTAMNVPSQLVNDLGHPGGNVTGLSYMGSQLAGRRLEILKEVIPTISRVAVFGSGQNLERFALAHLLGVQLQIVTVRKPGIIRKCLLINGKRKSRSRRHRNTSHVVAEPNKNSCDRGKEPAAYDIP